MNVEQAKEAAQKALERLGAELEQGQSETLKAYLAAMGRFHRYSVRNAMLISLARPDATRVAGFKTWKQLGRHVRKGEHGIVILAPIRRRARKQQRDERAEDEDPAEQPDRDEEEERVTGFRAAYVFDISQTEGAPVPEFACVAGDPGPYMERLKAFVAAKGITLEYSRCIAPARGACIGSTIVLLPGLPPAEHLSTLVHELGHSLLHRNEGRETVSKAVRETEAEAVAYVVCQAVGLDTNSAASDYVRLWGGDTKTLAASLERIRQAAVEIIEATTLVPDGQAGIRASEEPTPGPAADGVRGVSPRRFSAAA